MTFTLFGIFYFLIAILSFISSYQTVAGLFVISYLFQVSSVIDFGHSGIAPYIVSPVFLIAKGFLYSSHFEKPERKIALLTMVFVLFVIVQTVVATTVFGGMRVLANEGGMETVLKTSGAPLALSIKNVYQWVYLFLNTAGIVSLISHRHLISFEFGNKIFETVSWIVLIFGFMKYVTVNLSIPFPLDIIYCNPSVDLKNVEQQLFGVKRYTSVFVEASVCGLFLAVQFWTTCILKLKHRKLLMSLSLLGLLLSMSSTGFFLFSVGVVFFLYIQKRVRTMFYCVFMVALGVFVIYLSPYADRVYNMTFNKMGSESAGARFAVMEYGFSLFRDTSGFGCGLGSSIGSNLFTTILSQIGVLGLIIFCLYMYYIYLYLKKNGVGVMMLPILLVLVGQIMAVGYLSYPVLWMMIAICCCVSAEKLYAFSKKR